MIHWTSPKLQPFVLQKTPWRSWKEKLQTGKKYVQSTRSSEDLYLDYTKNCQKWIFEKAKNSIRKQAKHTKRHFTKEDRQIANKHTKVCSTSLTIREVQINTTVGYTIHLSQLPLFFTLAIWIGVFLFNFYCSLALILQ